MGAVNELTSAVWVTDPHPTPTGDKNTCKFKFYPTPDEVVFCDQPAVAVLTAPCCGAETPFCSDCLGKCAGLGTWICLSCGLRTDCKWTPIPFGIRWL